MLTAASASTVLAALVTFVRGPMTTEVGRELDRKRRR
eukprot:COSAG05_NODE_13179_length_439_cov_0.720588_1_plen_36_part_01